MFVRGGQKKECSSFLGPNLLLGIQKGGGKFSHKSTGGPEFFGA